MLKTCCNNGKERFFIKQRERDRLVEQKLVKLKLKKQQT